ncbi:YeiH family protein [Bifidobacterium choloepi]|uniref:Putative sulfate exporter family transporter n=1 Tax=Bifidobacterium choloepi TaxID=2614131 RepID=A0A6I5NG53_9BIFI|nr:putative sulfate exporter family transporter [Bifidobacterium choloepi]NEG69353.1 putative sulfate exporter family transporter [Bifidobacterium choloepi]
MRDFCTKWGKRIATPQMLVIAIVTLIASFIGMWLKQYPGFSLLGALIIALLVGMIVQFPIRAWYVGDNAVRAAGVKDAAGLISNKLLRLGIILLGFKLNLDLLFTTGLKCLPIAAVIVTLTVIVTYAIARWLGVSPLLAILVAGGTGICGAAAVMAISGSLNVGEDKKEEKSNDEVVAIAIVAIMGVVFALIELIFGPMTGLSDEQLGVIAGGSLHEIAHAVAVGAALGAEGETMAIIMKLSRVLMLVFAAIIIAIWYDKTQSDVKTAGGKRKIVFPWFMIGFIVASIIGTIIISVWGDGGQAFADGLVNIAYVVLGMAMAALGINVNFAVLAKKGGKALLASFLASILLLAFCVLIAIIFF